MTIKAHPYAGMLQFNPLHFPYFLALLALPTTEPLVYFRALSDGVSTGRSGCRRCVELGFERVEVIGSCIYV